MTKKRNSRQKHQKDASFADTSEEEFNDVKKQGKSCPHVSRGVNFGRVKRSLKTSECISVCSACPNTAEITEDGPEVWLCLQCGNRGCGRMSTDKHGIQHYKTIHSDCHSLVLSSSSGIVWCYDCDNEVHLQTSQNLKQCVEFIMKLKMSNSAKCIPKSVKNSSTDDQCIQEPLVNEVAAVQALNSIEAVKTTATQKAHETSKTELPPRESTVKGLRNLGNTCFFNAVMQNLSQIPLLFHELENSSLSNYLFQVPHFTLVNGAISEDENLENIKVSLPGQFPLANSLLDFFKKMQASSSSKVDVVNPVSLFGQISNRSPQFRNFQQQDSHELLRQLLDGVRQEEIRRQKKAILRWFDLEKVNPENIDDDTKKLIKAYGSYASHTIVEKIFGGLLISTVVCEECKVSSQVFEPCMDLSLPLFEEKLQENYDQLCPLLDGGKQEDVKPLRNRKGECDNEEDNSGEYVITKYKNDVSKPSKHQERKLKQLAKKEKKKGKNARGRKLSQGEQDTDCIDIFKKDPNLANHSALNDSTDQQKEVCSVDSREKSNVEIDNSEETIQMNAIASDSEVKHENETSNKEIMPNPKIAVQKEECFQTTECKETVHCEMKVYGSESSIGVTVIEPEKNIDDNNMNFDPKEAVPCHTQSAIGYDANIQDSSSSTLNVDEVVNNEDKFPENEVSLNEETAEISGVEKDCNNEIQPSSDKEVCDLDLDEEESNFKEQTVRQQSITNLVEDINSSFDISLTNYPGLDEMLQELSKQVKLMRIRRDSDKQENLLNSSQSTNDCGSQTTHCTSRDSHNEDTSSEENCENWSHGLSENQTKEWIQKSVTTLKPRRHVSPLEYSIDSCLSHFTKPELLTGSNKFRCENCTEMKYKKSGNKKNIAYTNASKQLLIFSPPAILTLHLKRFQQVGMSLRKVNRFVEFPLILDLAPYCSSACLILPHMASVKDEILYSLFGIVEHSGRLTSGHYTAYVKVTERTSNEAFMNQWPLVPCDFEQLLHKFSKINTPALDSSVKESSCENCRWYYISDNHVKEVNEAQVLKCQAYLLFYERIK